MALKNFPCTAIGIAAGIAVIVGGVAADMLMGSNRSCGCGIRHKASKAMHTIGSCLDRAADSIQNQQNF